MLTNIINTIFYTVVFSLALVGFTAPATAAEVFNEYYEPEKDPLYAEYVYTATTSDVTAPAKEFLDIKTVELARPKFNYTERDLFCLAAAVCREAGGDSEEIQMLVANVVINRVLHPYYPDTIEEVLTQKYQYGSMWKNGVSFPKWATEKTVEQCYKVAERILRGERVCPENAVYQAEFEQGSGLFKQFEGYFFCYY